MSNSYGKNINSSLVSRGGDKKLSNVSNAQLKEVQTQAVTCSPSVVSKKGGQEQQLQKVQGQPQENFQQIITQEVLDKIQVELMKIKQLEDFCASLKQENQEIKNQIKQQEQRIHEQDIKIQQQQGQLQIQEEKIQSQVQNQQNSGILEQINTFISNNNNAHDIWKKAQENIQKKQEYLENETKQIEGKVTEYLNNLSQVVNEHCNNISKQVKDELKGYSEQVYQTQQQANQNLSNLSMHEHSLDQFCQKIQNYLGNQGPQMQNYGDNKYQSFDQQQYQQVDQQMYQYPQYNQQQQDQLQYQQYQQQQQQPQQQYQPLMEQQPYSQQGSFISPQYQQNNYNAPLQNDMNATTQPIPNHQDQPSNTQAKSKIRLISQTSPQQQQ